MAAWIELVDDNPSARSSKNNTVPNSEQSRNLTNRLNAISADRHSDKHNLNDSYTGLLDGKNALRSPRNDYKNKPNEKKHITKQTTKPLESDQPHPKNLNKLKTGQKPVHDKRHPSPTKDQNKKPVSKKVYSDEESIEIVNSNPRETSGKNIPNESSSPRVLFYT